MTPEKVIEVVAVYRQRLEREGVPKERMDTIVSSPLTQKQMLAHVHYLLDGIEEYVKSPDTWGKANRHLGSVQTLLRCAGWYSLFDLMNHNRPS